MTIHDNLAEIQRHMRAPKNKTNEFGGYKYRNAESIMGAFKDGGHPGSLVCTDSVHEVGGQIFVEAKATLTIDGEAIEATGHAMHPLQKKGMDASQITGSASSYARKYALCGLFAIEDESQDPDGRDNRNENGQTPPPPKERNPDELRDGLISAVKKAESTDALNRILGGQKFDAAWQWLAENHEGHSLEVKRVVDEVRENHSAKEAE